MAKWTYFTMGIMAGIIAVLLTVVATNNRLPQAEASGLPPATLPLAALQGTDNTGQGLMLATGGATSQQQDVLWVLFKRAASRRAGAASTDVTSKDEKISLCCYQVGTGGRNVKLVAARDISFDMDVVEFQNEKPHVKDIIEELKKSAPREKEEKK